MSTYRKFANYLLGFITIFFYFGGIAMLFAVDYQEEFWRFHAHPIPVSVFYIVGTLGTHFGVYLMINKPLGSFIDE